MAAYCKDALNPAERIRRKNMKLTAILFAAVMSPAAVQALELERLDAAGLAEMMGTAGISAPAPRAAEAAKRGALVAAKSIRLVAEQGSVDFADHSAEMTVTCSYKAGLFIPQARECGRRKLPVALDADGVLHIPAVEAFDAPRGRDLENFSAHISVREKGAGDGYLFAMEIRGKRAFEAYARSAPVLSVLKMDAGEAQLLAGGVPLADTELAKDPSARLISSVLTGSGSPDGIMLVFPTGENGHYDNLEHTSEGSLAGLGNLPLGPVVLVERAGDPRKVELLTTLRAEGPGGAVISLSSRIEVRKTRAGLKEIGRIDLR